MTVRELIDLLHDSRNPPIVLDGGAPGCQVVCAPTLVGRVMTAAFDGAAGEVLGWIGENEILRGPVDSTFNNFGGKERLWFGPEGTQFGLYFGTDEQIFSNYRVPPALSSQPYRVVDQSSGSLLMNYSAQFVNASGTRFHLDVLRSVTAVSTCPYLEGFQQGTGCVGFQSVTTVRNLGSRMSPETGGLCCWTPGQQVSRAPTVVVIPLRDNGSEEPLRTQYYKDFCTGGSLPRGRVHVNDRRALIRSDGQCRLKVGVSPSRAVDRLGSVNLATGDMVIQDFDLALDAPYLTPYWRECGPGDQFRGEASSVYIDGPDNNGQRAGEFYELETLSPALFLKTQQIASHRNRVIHLRGELSQIDGVASRFLNTSVDDVRRFLAGDYE